jgi:hypothetical protein
MLSAVSDRGQMATLVKNATLSDHTPNLDGLSLRPCRSQQAMRRSTRMGVEKWDEQMITDAMHCIASSRRTPFGPNKTKAQKAFESHDSGP